MNAPLVMFGFAVKAEAAHAELYTQALAAAAQGLDLAQARFYLCPFCGHIEFGVPPERWPSASACSSTGGYIDVHS